MKMIRINGGFYSEGCCTFPFFLVTSHDFFTCARNKKTVRSSPRSHPPPKNSTMHSSISNPAVVGFLVVFVSLASAALLFPDKFKFLQSKTQSSDATGACPQRCCKSCSLNMFLVILFAGGLGAATGLIVHLSEKKKRDQLTAAIRQHLSGGDVSVAPAA